MRRRTLGFFCAGLTAFAGACTDPITVATEDATDADGGGTDVAPDGRDADEEEEFIFVDADVPPDGPPAVWTADDCMGYGGSMRVIELGHTGDACSMGGTCEVMSLNPEHPSRFAACDPAGHLITGSVTCRMCTAPAAAPWTDCEAALAGGASGQQCSGDWACVARSPTDRCCIVAAECGSSRDARYWPSDVLGVSELCLKDCPAAPFADRPTRDACPGPRSPADPEPLLGDACTGDWACAADRSAFAAPPTFVSPVPVWCADGVLQLSPRYGCGCDWSTCE